MNNSILRKTMETVNKHRDIKLVTTERRRKYLVSEPSYRTTKFFTENLLAMEMKKQNRDNYKYTCLFKTPDLSKILMYEFSYYYIERKYGKKQNCVLWIQKGSLYT